MINVLFTFWKKNKDFFIIGTLVGIISLFKIDNWLIYFLFLNSPYLNYKSKFFKFRQKITKYFIEKTENKKEQTVFIINFFLKLPFPNKELKKYF